MTLASKSKHVIWWLLIICGLLCESMKVYAQLTSDFNAEKQEDAKSTLNEVLRLCHDENNWISASDLSSSLENQIRKLEVILPLENFRTKSLRPYLALQYFYLGLAKAKVGFAAQAKKYFELCKSTDPNVLEFIIKLESEEGTVSSFIDRYYQELERKASEVKFRVISYLYQEQLDPTQIKIAQIDPQSQAEIELDTFKSYLLKAISAYWEKTETNWVNGDEFPLYFPRGTYRLSSADSSCEEIVFSVPTNGKIELKPYRWFSLKLPPKCALGKNVKIFRIFTFTGEQEITRSDQLRKLPFGGYRFQAKGGNYKDCFPNRVEFLMEGIAPPKEPLNEAKQFRVKERSEFSFPNCAQ